MKKKLIVSALTSTLLVSSLALTPEVLANEYDEAIQENMNIIEDTENKIHNLEGTIDSLHVDVQTTEDELEAINEEISANEERVTEAVEKLEAAHTTMKALQEEVLELEAVIEMRNEQLEKQARKIQVDGQAVNFIEFLIDADSLSDILGRIDVVANLVGTNRKLVDAQVRDQQAVIKKQEQTEETIVRQNALAAELEGMSEELEQQRLEKEVLVAQLASARATAEEDRDRFLSEKAEAEKAVMELVAAREEAAQAAQAAERRRAEAEVAASSSQESGPAENASVGEAHSSSSESSSSQEAASSSQETQPVKETSKPKPDPKPAPEQSSGGVTWEEISSYANGVLGTPYLYGGSTTRAFDCSGFTSYVFRQVGVNLPRSAAGQYASSQKVSNPRPGDLVFFSENGSRVSHVGIYVGNGQFIGAQTSTGVAYTQVHSNYWGRRLVGYGRY
ncbi:Cell wall-associated hydrolase, NlpC family [Alkalibacterium subtropicum]|uniref:Cell wall-associated hydrolase, NlpC family n=1 Tax=Alkalibacterium subtropicum TaxID=753702 RepID=A0A1I1GSK3_9LACT|nr:C40 family peptidase [Alkalibacterium subtropicum]SFC14282.1 Cell wall-associated hydrolase, NlpC family [Alkalibacterium subtropicum]